jgi:hypothetical protein
MALTQQAQVVPFTVPVKALTDTTIPINGVCKITLYKEHLIDDRPISEHNFLVTSQKKAVLRVHTWK